MRRALIPILTVLGAILGVVAAPPAAGVPGEPPEDTTPPTITITSPADGQVIERGSTVTVAYQCVDIALVSCTGPVASGALLPTHTLGTFPFTVEAEDLWGNTSVRTHTYTVRDTTLPTVTVFSPQADAQIARGTTAPAHYACADGGFPVNCTATVGTLIVPNGHPLPTSELGSHTLVVTARDAVGWITIVRRTYEVVDRTAPSVTIARPLNGARFTRGQVVRADFACADDAGGSGLASCTGTVPDGAPLPTGRVGTFPLRVTAVDNEGNTTVEEVTYRVVAPTCGGRAVTVMLRLGDRPTPRADVILGTPGRNVINARGGNDVVCGLGGNDVLRGGPGADRLLGGAGRDHLAGGGQRDTCVGGPQRDTHASCEVRRGLP